MKLFYNFYIYLISMNPYIYKFLLKEFPKLYNDKWRIDTLNGELYYTPYYNIYCCNILISKENKIIITYNSYLGLKIAFWQILYWVLSSVTEYSNDGGITYKKFNLELSSIDIYCVITQSKKRIYYKDLFFNNIYDNIYDMNKKFIFKIKSLNYINLCFFEEFFFNNIKNPNNQIIITFNKNFSDSEFNPNYIINYFIDTSKPEYYYLDKELDVLFNKQNHFE